MRTVAEHVLEWSRFHRSQEEFTQGNIQDKLFFDSVIWNDQLDPEYVGYNLFS